MNTDKEKREKEWRKRWAAAGRVSKGGNTDLSAISASVLFIIDALRSLKRGACKRAVEKRSICAHKILLGERDILSPQH